MGASASHTMRFDVVVERDAVIGGPDVYVARPGFWHGGAGVAACWFGGALGVIDALALRVRNGGDPLDAAAFGRCRARLDVAGALLKRSADEIDADPNDVEWARKRGDERATRRGGDLARRAAHDRRRAGFDTVVSRDDEHSRRVADLEVYLRQLDAAHAAQLYGTDYADDIVRW